MEVGQRTREEIVTWNQMTALKFQTEVKRKTTPASLWGMERQRGGEKERERERERSATILLDYHTIDKVLFDVLQGTNFKN